MCKFALCHELFVSWLRGALENDVSKTSFKSSHHWVLPLRHAAESAFGQRHRSPTFNPLAPRVGPGPSRVVDSNSRSSRPKNRQQIKRADWHIQHKTSPPSHASPVAMSGANLGFTSIYHPSINGFVTNCEAIPKIIR